MGKKRIIILDDMEPMLQAILYAVEGAGDFDIATASDVETATELIQTHGCDLLIADVRLIDYDIEDESGLDFAITVNKRLAPDARIIALSAYLSINRIQKFFTEIDRAATIDYIEKNETWDIKLVEALKKALDES